MSDTRSEDGEESPLNDFRFNFQIVVQPPGPSRLAPVEVAGPETFYPQLFKNWTAECGYTIENMLQKPGRHAFVCLLCNVHCKPPSNRVNKAAVIEHITGQKHMKNMQNPELIEALKKYHKYFSKHNQNLQICFRPNNAKLLCSLCYGVVGYEAVLKHMKTPGHIYKVKKYLSSMDIFNKELIAQASNLKGLKIWEEKPKKEATVKAKNKKEIPLVTNGNDLLLEAKQTNTENHQVILAVDHPESDNILDLIPQRYSEMKTSLILLDGTVNCTPCNTKLKDLDQILSHFHEETHMFASRTTPPELAYSCQICKYEAVSEIDFRRHVKNPPKSHGKLAEDVINNLKEYECLTCNAVYFGSESILKKHFRERYRQVNKATAPKIIKQLVSMADFFDNCENLLTVHQEELEAETERNTTTLERIEKQLFKSFPKSKAYAFGSRVSGLGNKDSDLDVFVDVDNLYDGYERQSLNDQIVILRKVASIFRQDPQNFTVKFTVPTARTPIVRLHDCITKLDCDLSFRHGLAVENTKFILTCIAMQPILKPFILMLKHWRAKFTQERLISSYAVVILGIFYFQMNDYLLSVQKLRLQNPQEPRVIQGWPVIEYTADVEDLKKLVKPCTKSLNELMQDFCDFYLLYKFETLIVCPLTGKPFPKELFENTSGESLPSDMEAYKTQIKEGFEHIRIDKPMCVQDPFDLSHNLTKSCTEQFLESFQKECQLTSIFLQPK